MTQTTLLAATLALTIFGAAATATTVWEPEVGFVDLDAPMASTPEGYYARAVALMVRGDYAPAEELLQNALKRFPGAPEGGRTQARMAKCELALGRAQRAFDRCCTLLAAPSAGVEPAQVHALRLEAARAVLADDADDGVRCLQLIGRDVADPNAPAALWQLGERAAAGGDYAQARLAYAALVKRYPAAAQARWAAFRAVVARLHLLETGGDATDLPAITSELETFAGSAEDKALAARAHDYLFVAQHLAGADAVERRVYFAVMHYIDGDYKGAYRMCGRALVALKTGAAAETAMFYRARAAQARNDYKTAYRLYEELLHAFPNTRYRFDVFNAEFDIAAKLRERSGSLAMDVLERLLSHDPKGPRAAEALMLRGSWYFQHENWESTLFAYDAVLRDFGHTAYAGEALYRSGACQLARADIYDNVDDILASAARAFAAYAADFPGGPFVKDATAGLAAVRERQAERLLDVAAFYDRTDRPGARRVYLKLTAERFPQTKAGLRAKTELDRLKGAQP